MPPDVWYFGCCPRAWSEAGHFLWNRPDGDRTPYRARPMPFELDGPWCPHTDGRQSEGPARITRWRRAVPAMLPASLPEERPTWTIVSWWDRSVDTRPGSHSTLVAAGDWPFDMMMAVARQKFPAVFARQAHGVYLAEVATHDE